VYAQELLALSPKQLSADILRHMQICLKLRGIRTLTPFVTSGTVRLRCVSKSQIWTKLLILVLTCSEFQRQSEENFELSQIYEAQLQENSADNEAMMYEQEQFGAEMEQD
jgi:hypothetical protein